MKLRNVILDTGALAALLNRNDQRHAWASAQLKEIVPPLLTCEAVLSETHFILRGIPPSRQAIMELAINGFYQVAFSIVDEKQSVKRLLEKYVDVPISVADACLVRMSELYPDGAVFTTNGDFNIYRRNGRQPIPLIFPE
jgi:predicted nucleic acid-binding protein